ncbi:hypothetical protein DVW08_17285 [Clostridium botulinum]|nr:hypothetical protein [Clostridium botulinum]
MLHYYLSTIKLEYRHFGYKSKDLSQCLVLLNTGFLIYHYALK